MIDIESATAGRWLRFLLVNVRIAVRVRCGVWYDACSQFGTTNAKSGTSLYESGTINRKSGTSLLESGTTHELILSKYILYLEK